MAESGLAQTRAEERTGLLKLQQMRNHELKSGSEEVVEGEQQHVKPHGEENHVLEKPVQCFKIRSEF